jgi:hypothetical protein
MSKTSFSDFGSLLLTLILLASIVGCTPVTEGISPSGISVENSPLDEYRRLATGFQGTTEDQQRRIEAMEARTDELIAQCMHDAGFVYTPRTIDDFGNTVIHLGPDDESLSESEYEAWWAAYWGPGFDQNADGEFIWDFERAGCSGQAQFIVDRQFNLADTDEFRSLFEAMWELEDSLWSAPEFIVLNTEWSFCMADVGYSDLQFPESIPTAETAGSDQDLANLNCLEATNYVERSTEIIFTAENQFIADHRAELDALRNAVEQGGN